MKAERVPSSLHSPSVWIFDVSSFRKTSKQRQRQMLLSNAQLLLSGSEVGVHCLFSGTGFYTPLQVQEQGLLFPGEQESGFEATEVGAGEGVCVCVCVCVCVGVT